MMKLEDVISAIRPVDAAAKAACLEHFDRVAKPLGGLGRLEELLSRIAAVTGSAELELGKKAVAVFCADNGVVRQGVAQSNHEVTTAVARLLARGCASVSHMAKACGAEVHAVDVGMIDTVSGIESRKLMHGTEDISLGAAMSREIAEEAVLVGVETVRELRERGFRLIATGEAGIGNTTTSSAVCAALLGCPVRAVTGRGAGLSDEGLLRKIDAIERAIAVNWPDSDDPMDVLAKLGGLDIAAMTGLFLGGALYGVPIVMDGFISGAAALLAVRLCEDVRGCIIPSHESGEPGARLVLGELGFAPVIQAGLHLGEGTGAVALFPLLDMALAVYRDGSTFDEIAVEQYTRQA